MLNRQAHLVGSLPGPDARTAMTTALDIVGPYLRSLPDGETGPRSNWVGSAIDGLRGHPDLEVRGHGSGGDGAGQLRVRRGHRLFGASMDFGHVAATRDSHPVFEQLTADRDDVAFQQGVPGDFDMAALTLGPLAALRDRRAFTEATLAEIRGVRQIAGPSALFQIEVPLELVVMARTPAPGRPLLARLLTRNVTRLAAAAPAGTRFAVHLCVGDQEHRALVRPTDVMPLVVLANEIAAHCPRRIRWSWCTLRSRPPTTRRTPIPLSSRRCATCGYRPGWPSRPVSPTSPSRCGTRSGYATTPRPCWDGRSWSRRRVVWVGVRQPTGSPCGADGPALHRLVSRV